MIGTDVNLIFPVAFGPRGLEIWSLALRNICVMAGV